MLARLDDREVRAQLQELRTREEFAKRELDRQTELIGRGATTTQAYERVSMDLCAIQGLVSVQLEKLAVRAITAPIDGVVLRRDGEVGEIAEAGQILFRIGVLKPLQVVAEVNEETSRALRWVRSCCCVPMPSSASGSRAKSARSRR